MSGPAITNQNPATSVAIQGTDPVSFDVTDGDRAFRIIVILARYAGTDLYEVIHDGNSFAPLFVAQSAKESIANGYRFRCRRRGGWPGAVTLLTHAVDLAGNEAT